MVKIPLLGKYQNRATIVDDIDAVLAETGWRGKQSARHPVLYAQKRTTRLVTMLLHREVMERVLGRRLSSEERVDHKNGDGLDNRRQNLRLATHAQNMCNRRPSRGSTSRFLGVHYDSSRGKWRAKIKPVNGRYEHLGRFDSEVEAAVAYNVAAAREHGDFARLNVFGGDP